jgi:hypothetical protein
VRFYGGRYLIHGNLRHHLVEDRPHDLDEFWTIHRHDALSGLPRQNSMTVDCTRRVAGSLLNGQTQRRERNHARVRFDFSQKLRKALFVEAARAERYFIPPARW